MAAARSIRCAFGVGGSLGMLLAAQVALPEAPYAASALQSAAPSKTPGGVVVPGGSWETRRWTFVDVHYQPGNDADAELYIQFFEATHRGLRAEFAAFPVDALVQAPVRCGVWLHPTASKAISAGSALASTLYGSTPHCELHFLAPAAYSAQDRCCTKVGEVRDVDQFHRIAAHEYSTIVLDRITRQRGGWRFSSAPRWFEQGYEEYLGCMLATNHTRTVTLGKYRELVARTPSRLGDREVEDPYIDGTVLVQFLHEEFGRQQVQALMSNPANTFDEALRDTFGFGQGELFERARTKLKASK